MNPNICLQAIRDAYRQLLPLADAGCLDPGNVAELITDLAQGIEDLDGWLSRGGYAPAAWKAAR